MSKTISLHNTDKELVDAIKNKQSWAIEKLYTLDRKSIMHFVMNNSGDIEDARETLQEGVIAVYNNIISNKYKPEERAQLKTYLNQVCRNYWYKVLRSRGKYMQLDDHFEIADTEVSTQEPDEKLLKLKQYFAELGDKCQAVLRLRFEEKKKMEEIASILGNTVQVIKNRSSQCIRELYQKFNNSKL